MVFMSHFWNSDHFHSPVLTDGWGKYNFTRKSHKKSASNWSFEKYRCRELKVHIQGKFEILSGGKKEVIPLIHFIFFLN